MGLVGRSVLASMIAGAFIACSDTKPDEPDGGVIVTYPDAAIPQDTGLRALCPTGASPACSKASDCTDGGSQSPPPGCAGCRPYNRSLCLAANCAMPESTAVADFLNIEFQVAPVLRNTVVGFGGAAIGTETAGGLTITCADLLASSLDLSNGCYNIVDSRRLEITVPSDQYAMIFNRLPSGQSVLILIFGYAMVGAEGNPVGVSCSGPVAVQDPGSGAKQVAGDMMDPI